LWIWVRSFSITEFILEVQEDVRPVLRAYLKVNKLLDVSPWVLADCTRSSHSFCIHGFSLHDAANLDFAIWCTWPSHWYFLMQVASSSWCAGLQVFLLDDMWALMLILCGRVIWMCCGKGVVGR
jgi:hypothetical protein